MNVAAWERWSLVISLIPEIKFFPGVELGRCNPPELSELREFRGRRLRRMRA